MFYRCLHHYRLFWMVVILAIVRLLVLYETILINTALFKSVWVLFTEINTIRNYKDYHFSLFKMKCESWIDSWFWIAEAKHFFATILPKRNFAFFVFCDVKISIPPPHFWCYCCCENYLQKSKIGPSAIIIDVWWRTMGSFAVTDVNCDPATERVLCVGVLSFHQRWKPFKCLVR